MRVLLEVTWNQNHNAVLYYEQSLEIKFDMKCQKFLLRIIRHNCYLDLGNGLKKFGNH